MTNYAGFVILAEREFSSLSATDVRFFCWRSCWRLSWGVLRAIADAPSLELAKRNSYLASSFCTTVPSAIALVGLSASVRVV